MSNLSSRAFERDYCEVRIRYAIYNTEKYLDAKMQNSSEGGMYFQSESELHPGSEICIHRADYSPEIHGSAACKGYRAEVMWCRRLFNKDDNTSCYGVGVRFIVNTCEKCGETVAYSDIHRTDDFVFLCSKCLENIEKLPDGDKQCLNKYLIGNVL